MSTFCSWLSSIGIAWPWKSTTSQISLRFTGQSLSILPLTESIYRSKLPWSKGLSILILNFSVLKGSRDLEGISTNDDAIEKSEKRMSNLITKSTQWNWWHEFIWSFIWWTWTTATNCNSSFWNIQNYWNSPDIPFPFSCFMLCKPFSVYNKHNTYQYDIHHCHPTSLPFS